MSKTLNAQTARDLNALLEIELGAKVGSSIHMCITDKRLFNGESK